MSLTSNFIDPGIIAIPFLSPKNDEAATHISEEKIGRPPLRSRVYNFIKAWLSEIKFLTETYFVTRAENKYGKPAEYAHPSGECNHWRKGNRGLYVGIPGINAGPNILRKQLSILRREESNFEVRSLYVPKRGNCSLEEAIKPIEAMFRNYIQHNPGKPICILASSLGAVIAAELEVRLRDTSTPIKLSCLSGAFSGTKQMNLLKMFGLAKFWFPDPVIDTMLYQSQATTQLLQRMREPLKEGVEREYDFYATPNDFQIKPYTGSFPILSNKKVKYFLVPGENHNSIIERVATFQMRRCINWMHNFSS